MYTTGGPFIPTNFHQKLTDKLGFMGDLLAPIKPKLIICITGQKKQMIHTAHICT